VREEGGDLHGAQLARMPSPAELDEAAHPGDVGPLGSQAIVAKADLLANRGKERARRSGRGGVHVAVVPYRDTSHIARWGSG
jgi:hypothetical protein